MKLDFNWSIMALVVAILFLTLFSFYSKPAKDNQYKAFKFIIFFAFLQLLFITSYALISASNFYDIVKFTKTPLHIYFITVFANTITGKVLIFIFLAFLFQIILLLVNRERFKFEIILFSLLSSFGILLIIVFKEDFAKFANLTNLFQLKIFYLEPLFIIFAIVTFIFAFFSISQLLNNNLNSDKVRTYKQKSILSILLLLIISIFSFILVCYNFLYLGNITVWNWSLFNSLCFVFWLLSLILTFYIAILKGNRSSFLFHLLTSFFQLILTLLTFVFISTSFILSTCIVKPTIFQLSLFAIILLSILIINFLKSSKSVFCNIRFKLFSKKNLQFYSLFILLFLALQLFLSLINLFVNEFYSTEKCLCFSLSFSAFNSILIALCFISFALSLYREFKNKKIAVFKFVFSSFITLLLCGYLLIFFNNRHFNIKDIIIIASAFYLIISIFIAKPKTENLFSVLGGAVILFFFIIIQNNETRNRLKIVEIKEVTVDKYQQYSIENLTIKYKGTTTDKLNNIKFNLLLSKQKYKTNFEIQLVENKCIKRNNHFVTITNNGNIIFLFLSAHTLTDTNNCLKYNNSHSEELLKVNKSYKDTVLLTFVVLRYSYALVIGFLLLLFGLIIKIYKIHIS